MKIAALLAVLAAAPLAAQAPAGTQAGAEPATLRGVVVDSVRGGFLKGASVGVVGPSRIALADSLGRFSIDGITPGEYRVALFDALLDSLAISVISAPTRFTAGDTVELILAIPSPATIIAAKCGAPASDEESSALFGTVLRADDGAPVAGADVRVEWLEVAIDEATGVRTVPRSNRVRTDSAGRYKVCGLPSGLNAEITARRGDDSTAAVPMTYGDSRLGIANLFIAGAAAGRRTVGAPVRGIVVDGAGKPVGNAMVALSSSPAAVTTGSNGRFEIAGQRLGTQSVLVRRLGYEPVEVVVNVTSQPAGPLTVTLDEFVPIIESVVIEARHNAALERVGFARRRHYGLGRYYEAKDLEHVTNLENFFKTIPVLNRRMGLPLAKTNPGRAQDIIDVRDAPRPGGSNNTNARPRLADASEGGGGDESGSCRATFVDGVRVSQTDFLMPNEVAAIEIYSPTMTPSEFRALYATCTTVVIWTDWKLRRAQVRR